MVDEPDGKPDSKPDMTLATWWCLLLRVVVMMEYTMYETVCTPLTGAFYGWSQAENGVFWFTCGLGAVAFTIVLLAGAKRVGDYALLMLALCACTIGSATNLYFSAERGLPKAQFLLGAAFVTLGYTWGDSLVPAIFGKATQSGQQGRALGMLAASSAVARIIAPIVGTQLFFSVGSNAMFGLVTLLLFLATAASFSGPVRRRLLAVEG